MNLQLEERELHLRVIDGALVSPRRQLDGARFTGEVYDRMGDLVPASLRPNLPYGYQHTPQFTPTFDTEWLPGSLLYLGTIFEMYGHDLLEPTSRLWPLLADLPEGAIDGVLVHRWRPETTAVQIQSNEIVRFFLDRVTSCRLPIVVSPQTVVQVERLYVPEPAFRIAAGASKRFRHIVSRVVSSIEADPQAPIKIFMSRRRLGGKPRSRHEPYLERLFDAAGFTVLHPQELSLQAQIAILRRCRTLAGVDGSAMHSILFTRPEATVLCFDTRLVKTQSIVEVVAEAKGVHLTISDDTPWSSVSSYARAMIDYAP